MGSGFRLKDELKSRPLVVQGDMMIERKAYARLLDNLSNAAKWRSQRDHLKC